LDFNAVREHLAPGIIIFVIRVEAKRTLSLSSGITEMEHILTRGHLWALPAVECWTLADVIAWASRRAPCGNFVEDYQQIFVFARNNPFPGPTLLLSFDPDFENLGPNETRPLESTFHINPKEFLE
jgi:hypothetical protein